MLHSLCLFGEKTERECQNDVYKLKDYTVSSRNWA